MHLAVTFLAHDTPFDGIEAPRAALAWARYFALHEAIRIPLIGVHRLTFAQIGDRPAPSEPLLLGMRRRYRELLRRDFDNAASGVYPLELLFDLPLARYAAAFPQLVLDMPAVFERLRAHNFRDLPGGIDYSAFPAYYRRNFHWQTDGYFSRHSASLYDLSVELLFVGCADVMRRQVLAQVMHRKQPGPVRLLDVACGTGRFLAQAARTLPGSSLVGIDLSPWYVDFARENLARLELPATPEKPRAAVGNAEALNFDTASFDVVTSIFLLHELPRAVRRSVLAEMRRVLVPGGLLVLEDSAQPGESGEIAGSLVQFSKDMHEPFFADYLEDDLATLAAESGFEVQSVAPHFVSKVVVCRAV
jgi:ubiquinone/menaquinone biosynthesis C-methylase UbiE